MPLVWILFNWRGGEEGPEPPDGERVDDEEDSGVSSMGSGRVARVETRPRGWSSALLDSNGVVSVVGMIVVAVALFRMGGFMGLLAARTPPLALMFLKHSTPQGSL